MKRTRFVAALLAATITPAGAPATAAPALSAAAPTLGVRAAALIEATTGQRLYSGDADRELPIASTTKLMTALVALEHVHSLGTLFTQNDFHTSSQEAQVGLVPGERMSVHDLLLALLLPSAGDAAEDLAYNIGHGSISRFIAMMNTRARELGLNSTHYATPSGLDTPGNYSTAADLVALTRFLLLHHPFFAHAVSMSRAVLHTGNHLRVVTNRNDLVGRLRWVNGVKTGHTIAAGYVLVGSGTRDGMTLISAVLGTASPAARDANTLALLGYGFASFRLVRPIRAGAVIARLPIRYQPRARATVVAGRTVTGVILRGATVRIRLELPRRLSGPIPRHAVVGAAAVLAGGHQLARIPLLLQERLPAVTPTKVATRFLERPTTLVSLGLLLALVIGVGLVLRERVRGKSAARPDPAS